MRKGRRPIIGQAYLLTVVTEKRGPHFTDWRTGRFIAQEFTRESIHENVESLAWVVMPDHFHWLVVLRKGMLHELMLRAKAGSARGLNSFLGRRGRSWKRGCHDHAMRKDEDLRRAAGYIVANPVRAGLVDHCGEYSLWDAVWMSAATGYRRRWRQYQGAFVGAAHSREPHGRYGLRIIRIGSGIRGQSKFRSEATSLFDHAKAWFDARRSSF